MTAKVIGVLQDIVIPRAVAQAILINGYCDVSKQHDNFFRRQHTGAPLLTCFGKKARCAGASEKAKVVRKRTRAFLKGFGASRFEAETS